MRNPLLALSIAVALAAPGLAAAQQVDYFQVQLSGIEHCADLDNFKFGARNSSPMYIRIVDHQEWDLSENPIFTKGNTTSIIGETYLVNSKKLGFTGAQFTSDTFIAVDATATLDKNAVVTKISGTFILQAPKNDPNDPSPPLCNQTGKFKTLERVLVQP